jgi:hypothetical protein
VFRCFGGIHSTGQIGEIAAILPASIWIYYFLVNHSSNKTEICPPRNPQSGGYLLQQDFSIKAGRENLANLSPEKGRIDLELHKTIQKFWD